MAEVWNLHRVWLTCGDLTLAWAQSWWNYQEAEKHLRNKDQPIWKSLTQGRSELFREVDGLGLVNANWLKLEFNILLSNCMIIVFDVGVVRVQWM